MSMLLQYFEGQSQAAGKDLGTARSNYCGRDCQTEPDLAGSQSCSSSLGTEEGPKTRIRIVGGRVCSIAATASLQHRGAYAQEVKQLQRSRIPEQTARSAASGDDGHS
jgi:hypothetical protein